MGVKRSGAKSREFDDGRQHPDFRVQGICEDIVVNFSLAISVFCPILDKGGGNGDEARETEWFMKLFVWRRRVFVWRMAKDLK